MGALIKVMMHTRADGTRFEPEEFEMDWDFSGPYRQILAKFDPRDGEILEIEDWHGNDVSDRIFESVHEAILDLIETRKVETK